MAIEIKIYLLVISVLLLRRLAVVAMMAAAAAVVVLLHVRGVAACRQGSLTAARCRRRRHVWMVVVCHREFDCLIQQNSHRRQH